MQTAPATASPTLRGIHLALSRAKADIPAMASLLDAFGPLFSCRAELRAKASGWRGRKPDVDPERFSQGVFILADRGFQDMSSRLPAAAEKLLPVMSASFPAMAREFLALGDALASGAVPARKLADAAFGGKVEVPGVSAEALAFAAAELVRPFIERQAASLLPLVKDLPWNQAHCPVCGGAPNMSVLRKSGDDDTFIKSHGGRRFLRCSCCATEWTHKRVSCPACGCEEPDDLVVLSAPERPFERVDACKRCKSFLLCLDGGELVDVPDPDVAALTMLPLELHARKEGYVPMALHPWSDF